MTDFQTWDHDNLARFAKECFAKLQQREKQIETLEEELRVALNAYQRLLEKHAGKTD